MITKKLRRLRRDLGIAALERSCRVTLFGGVRQKAWRVPGTVEAGRHAMLMAELRYRLAST